jgi:(2R)-3-sulfolactate dehydrogenase (NADP+)
MRAMAIALLAPAESLPAMTDTITLSLDEADALVIRALTASGTSTDNARKLADGVMGAELDGIPSHGLMYVPIYCEHAKCGKIDGNATPELSEISSSAFLVDAKSGFAHPAIALGFEHMVPAARQHGVAALSVRNSYNCGVLGYHVARLADQGLLGLGFTNAPASIAPVGGTRPVVGTNPFACAVPARNGGTALLIDQSSSVVAKSEITKRAQAGKSIPEGWALDADGNATTDPAVALKGTMVPSGGYKGVGVGLLVEILAAALSGATLGINASSFATNDGGPPNTGQFFLALNADAFSGSAFHDRIETLIEAIAGQEGARVPGSRRHQAHERVPQEGIKVAGPLLERIKGYCA